MSKRRTQNAMEVKPDPTRQVTLLYNGSPKEIASKKIVLLFIPSPFFPLDPPLEFTNPIANCIFHSPKYIHIHHSYLILPLYTMQLTLNFLYLSLLFLYIYIFFLLIRFFLYYFAFAFSFSFLHCYFFLFSEEGKKNSKYNQSMWVVNVNFTSA